MVPLVEMHSLGFEDRRASPHHCELTAMPYLSRNNEPNLLNNGKQIKNSNKYSGVKTKFKPSVIH